MPVDGGVSLPMLSLYRIKANIVISRPQLEEQIGRLSRLIASLKKIRAKIILRKIIGDCITLQVCYCSYRGEDGLVYKYMISAESAKCCQGYSFLVIL